MAVKCLNDRQKCIGIKVVFYKNNSKRFSRPNYVVPENTIENCIEEDSTSEKYHLNCEVKGQNVEKRKLLRVLKSESTYAATTALRSSGEGDAAKLLK